MFKFIKILFTKKRLMKTKKLQYYFNEMFYTDKDFEKLIKQKD